MSNSNGPVGVKYWFPTEWKLDNSKFWKKTIKKLWRYNNMLPMFNVFSQSWRTFRNMVCVRTNWKQLAQQFSKAFRRSYFIHKLLNSFPYQKLSQAPLQAWFRTTLSAASTAQLLQLSFGVVNTDIYNRLQLITRQQQYRSAIFATAQHPVSVS